MDLSVVINELRETIIHLRNEVNELEKLKNDAFLQNLLLKENEELTNTIEVYKLKLIHLENQKNIPQIDCKAPLAENKNNVKESVQKNNKVKQLNTNVSTVSEIAVNKNIESKKDIKVESRKPVEESPVDVGRLDFRVGKIVDIKRHPDADTLYVEEVDIGKEKNLTVVSGLVKHIDEDFLRNKMVILLCNLKPVKMRGITSEAMVMCASTPEKVEVLIPPPGSVPGDLVQVQGYTRNPDLILNPKKKVWETLAPDLRTDGKNRATYKGAEWYIAEKGVITSPTLTDVNIK